MTDTLVREKLPESFEATIVYAKPGQDRPLMAADEIRQEVEPTDIIMTDARSLAQAPTIQDEGFALVQAPSAVADFEDPEQVTGRYFAEIAEHVKKLTGAAEVRIYPTYIYREANQNAAGSVRRLPAGTGAHIDFTPVNAREFLSVVADADDALSRYSRVAIYQTWRALSGGYQNMPLALSDGRSVGADDLMKADTRVPEQLGPITEFEFFLGKPSGEHRWYYYRGMQPDEMLVFEGYDFADPGRRNVLHSAYIDPTCPDGQPPRRSIEVRTFAFFE